MNVSLSQINVSEAELMFHQKFMSRKKNIGVFAWFWLLEKKIVYDSAIFTLIYKRIQEINKFLFKN